VVQAAPLQRDPGGTPVRWGWRRRSARRGPEGNAAFLSVWSSSSQESLRSPARGRQWDEWRRASVPPLRPSSPGYSQPKACWYPYSFPSAQGTPTYEAWEAQIKELTMHVQHCTDMAHSHSRSVAKGAGTMTVHQGGAAGNAACPEEEVPAAAVGHARPRAMAAGHVRPQAMAAGHTRLRAAAPAPAAAAQAKAVEVRSEPL
jgi:hypothetical protein